MLCYTYMIWAWIVKIYFIFCIQENISEFLHFNFQFNWTIHQKAIQKIKTKYKNLELTTFSLLLRHQKHLTKVS